MKKNNYGFTFIELIIVISIIILVSSLTIVNFGKNIEKFSLNDEINGFNETILQLDGKMGKEITDYNLYISTGSFYYFETNNFYRKYLQKFTINSYTGTIKTNNDTQDVNDLSIFINDRKKDDQEIESTGSYVFNFSEIGKYKISGNVGEETLNDINIGYYSNFDTSKNIELTSIVDESGNSYSGIIIKNSVGQKREIFDLSNQKIDSNIKLNFLSNSNQTSLIINK